MFLTIFIFQFGKHQILQHQNQRGSQIVANSQIHYDRNCPLILSCFLFSIEYLYDLFLSNLTS